MKKIAHLTSAHDRYDIRICQKMCRTLTVKYSTYLIVADSRPNETYHNVNIIGVKKAPSRLQRMIFSPLMVLKRAVLLNADLYHIHDPELIIAGLCLRLFGKKVIIDAHEDVPAQLKSKPYLAHGLAGLLSSCYAGAERCLLRYFTAVVAATPYIARRLSRFNSLTVAINNYPVHSENYHVELDECVEFKRVLYLGNISRIRGAEIIIECFRDSGIGLELVGGVAERSLREKIEDLPSNYNITYHGHVGREKLGPIISKCSAGLVTFLNAPNHLHSQPNKLFEYMSFGMPVIASDFPLWREILTDNKCGVLVDPASSKSIREAILWLSENDQMAREMGTNGAQAVKDRYNWEIESKKILDLYSKIFELG